jgi:hypothetical protein
MWWAPKTQWRWRWGRTVRWRMRSSRMSISVSGLRRKRRKKRGFPTKLIYNDAYVNWIGLLYLK